MGAHCIVRCPVCNQEIGRKVRQEAAEFICRSEGCSQTKHYFLPGQVKNPGKSVPGLITMRKRLFVDVLPVDLGSQWT